MADDVSAGELHRRLTAHEERTDRAHSELDNRITNLAKDMVPMQVYETEQRARVEEARRLEREHVEDVREVRAEIRELRERPSMTLGRWLTVLGVVAAFLTVGVMAWGTLRGAK